MVHGGRGTDAQGHRRAYCTRVRDTPKSPRATDGTACTSYTIDVAMTHLACSRCTVHRYDSILSILVLVVTESTCSVYRVDFEAFVVRLNQRYDRRSLSCAQLNCEQVNCVFLYRRDILAVAFSDVQKRLVSRLGVRSNRHTNNSSQQRTELITTPGFTRYTCIDRPSCFTSEEPCIKQISCHGA